MKRLLKHPTKPIEVLPDKRVSELTEEMLYTAFQGRKLAESIDVWSQMLKSRYLVIWMGLAGAMVPAGMRRIFAYLIKRRMIDVLVVTGANLYHDLCESLGVKHFIGSPFVDDVKLRESKVDRIYDVFADEDKFYEVDRVIMNDFCLLLKDNYPYSSREVLYLLGGFLNKYAKEKDSILINAYKNKVPIFCPALCDSSLGFSIMFANRRKTERIVKIRGDEVVLKKRKIIIDELKDIDESAKITEKAKQTGVIYIGGGVPKNFIQQTAVIAGYQVRSDRSHKYAIQITTERPEWGGLSGATFEEAQSWGKIKPDAKKVSCYADATIALPIVSHALSDKFKKLSRNVPLFNWAAGNFSIEYNRLKL